jgi:hypothetical protein
MKTNQTPLRLLLLAALSLPCSIATASTDQPLGATTEDGRKVVLHPDGRWEYGTTDGAAPSGAAATKASAGGTANAAKVDDRYCVGGLFGVGRRLCPGDPEYNRGSLNPKLR